MYAGRMYISYTFQNLRNFKRARASGISGVETVADLQNTLI